MVLYWQEYCRGAVSEGVFWAISHVYDTRCMILAYIACRTMYLVYGDLGLVLRDEALLF